MSNSLWNRRRRVPALLGNDGIQVVTNFWCSSIKPALIQTSNDGFSLQESQMTLVRASCPCAWHLISLYSVQIYGQKQGSISCKLYGIYRRMPAASSLIPDQRKQWKLEHAMARRNQRKCRNPPSMWDDQQQKASSAWI